jgi:hypothetical protein
MKPSHIIPAVASLSLLFFQSFLLADDHGPGRPGTVNYVEGQVFLGTESLDEQSVGRVVVDPGETLTTQTGKAEILLTPGVFVRVGDSSSATMISSGLTNTKMSITAKPLSKLRKSIPKMICEFWWMANRQNY